LKSENFPGGKGVLKMCQMKRAQMLLLFPPVAPFCSAPAFSSFELQKRQIGAAKSAESEKRVGSFGHPSAYKGHKRYSASCLLLTANEEATVLTRTSKN